MSTDFDEFETPTTEHNVHSADEKLYRGIVNLTEISVEQRTPINSLDNADDVQDNNSGFIWVPLMVLMGIVILSALVYLMARNRRRIVHIYSKRRHIPGYSIDRLDADFGDCGEVGGEDNDSINDPTECLLKGKLQIDKNRYASCQKIDVTQIGSSKDLYA